MGNKRSTYATLHVSNWFFWLGVGNIFAVFHDNTLVSCSFLFAARLSWSFLRPIMQLISICPNEGDLLSLPIHLWPTELSRYEQGYHTVYTERRQFYPGVNEDEVPTYISHQRMEEQQH